MAHNFISSYNGDEIINVESSGTIKPTTANTADKCCVKFILSPGNTVGAFASTICQCFLFGDGAAAQYLDWYIEYCHVSGSEIVIANTDCGYVVYGDQIA
jgi:hypothetical protein